MTQKIASGNKRIYLVFLAIAIFGGLIAFLAIGSTPCSEMGCLINFFAIFLIPWFAAGIMLLLMFFSWSYATNKKGYPLFAIFLTLLLSLLIAILSQRSVDTLFVFLMAPGIPIYFARTWWLLLPIIIIPLLLIKYVKPEGTAKRFWFFIIVLVVVPGLINGVVFTQVESEVANSASSLWLQWGEKQAAESQASLELINKAVQENDLNACYNIGEYKEVCILEIAEMRDDVSLCDEINGAVKYSCYSYFAEKNNDSSLCEKIKWGSKDSCFRAVAIAANRPELCQKIDPENQKYCISDVAQAHKNPQLCDGLPDEEESRLKKNCYQGSSQTVEECIGYVPDEPENCILAIAISTRDIELCERLPQERVNSCIDVVNSMIERDKAQAQQ